MKKTFKSGISLIAVLLFMLAATTASIIVFRWISQENFSSGARLKASEAYQASQAGLEAVQGWLTNKGADAGALIRVFEMEAGKPVLLNDLGGQTVNLLAGDIFKGSSKRGQGFEVYLTGVNTEKQPYKFKFLSIGTARDGSRHSQIGIFEVEGLYKVGLPTPPGNKAKKVPPFFGSVGNATQGNWTGAHVIGDMTSTSGFTSKEDAIITGSATISGSASGDVGCPNSTDNPKSLAERPNPYIATDYGNFYVREDFKPGGDMGFCGSVYVGGDMEMSNSQIGIWGDLYVAGNLKINKKLKVYGNVTIKGNITTESLDGFEIKGNLVMPSSSSTININDNSKEVKIGGDVWIAGTLAASGINLKFCGGSTNHLYMTNVESVENETYCKQGEYNFTSLCSGGCSASSMDETNKPKGADSLSYLGNQITTEKNADGKYTIPDPIVLGFASEWENLSIPEGCTDLKGFSSNSSGAITINNNMSASSFMEAINSCYVSGGNWSSSENSTNWLVLKVNWSLINNFQDQTFEGNFIIIVENKPPEKIELPLTTTNTNVLLYLKEGANEIQLSNPAAGKARNYFIYSKADIETINGSQYLKGNIFMANGTKVNTISDPKIESNDALFEALSEAGVIQDNPNRCNGTGNADENGNCKDDGTTEPITPPPLNPENDPSLVYVPTIPHLKVVLQSQYANEEDPGDFANAKPAILVMPRIVYAQPGEMTDIDKLLERFNVLYLNGAYPGNNKPDIKNALQTNCYGFIPDKSGRFICTVDLKNGCNNSELCKNSFYIDIATTGAPSGSGGTGGTGEGGQSVTLTCSGPTSGTAGTAITPPTLICSNGSTPSDVEWTNGGLDFENPTAGNYNISVSADCGTGSTISGNCGNVTVSSNITLTCEIDSEIIIGTDISDAEGVNITCGDNSDFTVNSYTINDQSPANLTAGTYNKIFVTATCGSEQVSASCTGTLVVKGLICDNKINLHVKPNTTITERPTVSCWPSSDSKSNEIFNFDWTVPETAEVNHVYDITATANCDTTEMPAVNCGTVKVAGITCTPASTTVPKGNTVPAPALKCTDGSNATGVNYNAPSPPFTASQNLGTQYSITGTASCGETYLSSIPFTCPEITVTEGPVSIAINDSEAYGPLTGPVTFTCEEQIGIKCYADPSEDIIIECGSNTLTISQWGGSYIGNCSDGAGHGGVLEGCVFPTDKRIYCKNNNN